MRRRLTSGTRTLMPRDALRLVFAFTAGHGTDDTCGHPARRVRKVVVARHARRDRRARRLDEVNETFEFAWCPGATALRRRA